MVHILRFKGENGTNSRCISCPGSRADTRSPAGSAGWSPRSWTCGAPGGCSWFHTLLPNPENDTLIPHRHSRSQKIHAGPGCCGLQPDHLRRVRLGWRAEEGRLLPGEKNRVWSLPCWERRRNACVCLRSDRSSSLDQKGWKSGEEAAADAAFDASSQHGDQTDQTTSRERRGVKVSSQYPPKCRQHRDCTASHADVNIHY